MNATRWACTGSLLLACSLESAPATSESAVRAATVTSWSIAPDTTILRQSIATHYEAPFLGLVVGRERALLIDTGTGDADVRSAVDAALTGRDVALLVAHSHGHGDHVGGDRQFVGRPRTTTVGRSPEAVATAFGLVDGVGTIDLGGRILDVLAIPGHEPAHVAYYDRRTKILYTGDALYPGRLYVRDWRAYRASIARLVAFVDAGHPVSHVLGAHVELSADGVEYPEGAEAHPNEHALPLGEADLRDLHATLEQLGDTPARIRRPNFVIVPL